MKILVTGSEGNIGRKLVPFLESKNHIVHRCDIVQGVGDNYTVCNINSPLELTIAFDRFEPEVVINMAAMVSRVTCEDSQALTVQTNVFGTQNVIELCKLYGAKLIHFSTSEVYGDIGGMLTEDREDLQPNNIYGVSKLMSEVLVKYAISNGLRATIVRPFMIYDEDETMGAHRSAMIRFAEQLVAGNKIQVHKGSVRSWLHIDDTVALIEALVCNKPSDGLTVNIGHPDKQEISQLAFAMCDMLNLEINSHIDIVTIPDKMTLRKDPDVRLQEELTGITPRVSLEEGIRRVLDKMIDKS